MISRYEVKDIADIWTDQNKFQNFLVIELALLEALESEKQIPEKTHEHFKNVKIDPKRIEEIEKETRHDVIAFCTSITEQVPTEMGKFFHYGVTSSDIIDSALSLQIRESLTIQLNAMKELLQSLTLRAQETKDWLTIGRSHGMFAEPMSFGQKFLSYVTELKRRIKDLEEIIAEEITMQLSGSVGNYTLLSPTIESYVAKKLKLKVEPLSTQVIPRDRIAKILQANALTACLIERFCIEVRHLHHSDVKELAEGFAKGQKGSSIMPHKKNPISSENLSGLSRVIRSHADIAMQNTLLWHERDISHSSAERMILPDNFGLTVYALRRFKTMVDNLELYRENIENKVFQNAHYLSSYYMHFLIESVPNIKREDLYKILQTVSFAENTNTPEKFRATLLTELQRENIQTNLPIVDAKGLRAIYLKSIDTIFERSLNS
ncbi:MAG: adenylosuccinate lyase [Bacteriovoracaceae bacterium]|nr:adenylosuccinate lyase [Bacteriovoracaceae bacterium]